MELKARDRVLLLLKTGRVGDKYWRHGVILNEATGVHHKVFTGSRVVRDIDFSNKGVSKKGTLCKETLMFSWVDPYVFFSTAFSTHSTLDYSTAFSTYIIELP